MTTEQAHPPTDAEQVVTYRTANAQLRTRVAELEGVIERLRADANKIEARYLSAVDGRMKFRQAFRKAREESKSARAWMATYAWPLLDELEGYQNTPRVSSDNATPEPAPLEETQEGGHAR